MSGRGSGRAKLFESLRVSLPPRGSLRIPPDRISDSQLEHGDANSQFSDCEGKPSLGVRPPSNNKTDSHMDCEAASNAHGSNDPMDDFLKEPFGDANFNTYVRGPGQDLDSAREGYVKLHVGNIPRSLSKSALHTLFAHFGKNPQISVNEVCGASPGYGPYSKDTTWGFVVFQKHREAQIAIKELNERPPHNLRVAFARDPNRKKEFPDVPAEHPAPELARSSWDSDETREKPPSIIRGKPPNVPTDSVPTARSEKYEQGVFSVFIPPRAVSLHNLNIDKLTCENQTNSVVYGSGRPSRETEDIPPKAQRIQPSEVKVCSKTAPGKKLDLPTNVGECVYCGDLALRKCSGCKVLYCGSSCQEKDWKRHSTLCQVGGVTNGHAVSPDQPAAYDIRYSFLKLDDAVNGHSITSDRQGGDEFVACPPDGVERSTESVQNISTESSDDILHVLSGEELAAVLGSRSEPASESTEVGHKEVDERTESDHTSLPFQDFENVVIVHREGPGDFWVLNENRVRQLVGYSRTLSERSERKGSVVSRIGHTFGCCYQENWCRILLTNYSLSTPEHVTGFLIDFGYSVEIHPKNLLPLPQDLEEASPLALRIKLSDESPLEYLNMQVKGCLAVKAVRKLPNCAILVEAKVRSSAVTPKCSIRVVELPTKGKCHLTAFHTPHAIYVRPLTPLASKIFHLVTQDVASCCAEASPMETLPSIGEVVGACWDGNFYRALVTGTNGNKAQVIYLDYGHIDSVPIENLRSLPDLFKKIPATAVKIGLKGVQYQLFNLPSRLLLNPCVEKELTFGYEHEGDLSCVKLFDQNELINDELNKVLLPSHMKEDEDSDYYLEQHIVWADWQKSARLSGAATNVVGYNELYFVAHSPEFVYVREVLTKQITEHCKSLKMKQYVPRLNEYALVLYGDCWHRALCKYDLHLPHTAEVFFVDFGNTGEVPIEDIRPMAPEFVPIPVTAKLCRIDGLPAAEALTEDQRQQVASALEEVNEIVVLDSYAHACKAYVPSLERLLQGFGLHYSYLEVEEARGN